MTKIRFYEYLLTAKITPYQFMAEALIIVTGKNLITAKQLEDNWNQLVNVHKNAPTIIENVRAQFLMRRFDTVHRELVKWMIVHHKIKWTEFKYNV